MAFALGATLRWHHVGPGEAPWGALGVLWHLHLVVRSKHPNFIMKAQISCSPSFTGTVQHHVFPWCAQTSFPTPWKRMTLILV